MIKYQKTKTIIFIGFLCLSVAHLQAQQADALKASEVFDTPSTQFSSWLPVPPILAGILGKPDRPSSSPQATIPDESSSWQPSDAFNQEKIGIAAKFIPIAPGTFLMGSPEDQKDRQGDETQHQVTLTQSFEIQVTEVTQLQYFLITGKNPSKFKEEWACDPNNFKIISGVTLCANHPVESISWNEVSDPNGFIEILNQSQTQYTYRLPTEAEWEYVAKVGLNPSFPYSFFGYNKDYQIDYYAWSSRNSSSTQAVATKNRSSVGLFDLHGNVAEWVQDTYASYPTTAVADPIDNAGSYRVARGGSWNSPMAYLRSSFRASSWPGYQYSIIGFRLVRSPR